MKRKRTILFSDYTVPQAADDQKDACIRSVSREAGVAPRGESLFAQIRTQIGYVGAWFFIGLAIILGAMLLVFHEVQKQAVPADNTPIVVLALFGMIGPAIGCISAPILARSHTNDMWELEEAAFYNMPRLTSIRLLICSLAALPVMVVLAIVGSNMVEILHSLTALLAPFFLINGINYFILGRVRGMAGSLCCIGSGLILAVVLVVIPAGIEFSGFSVESNLASLLSISVICACTIFFALSARRYIVQSTISQ